MDTSNGYGGLYPEDINGGYAYSQNGNHTSDRDGDVYYDAVGVNPNGGDPTGGGANRTDILKLVLYDLNSAIAPRDIRLMAIHSALEEFDHDDEVLHDEELELRADHILLQKLTYATSVDPRSAEVGYICSAMEAVYRAGRARLAQSFHEICDALLPLFVEMIRPPPGHVPAGAGGTGRHDDEGNATGEGRGVDGNDVDALPNAGSGEHRHHPPDSDQQQQAARRSELSGSGYFVQQSYGDYDEESAESVEIPSGTGEYFEEMSSDRGNFAGIDKSESTAGINVPAGTKAYFDEIEEMKRRAAEGTGGVGTAQQQQQHGGGGGSHVDNTAPGAGAQQATTMQGGAVGFPEPPDGLEHALVLRPPGPAYTHNAAGPVAVPSDPSIQGGAQNPRHGANGTGNIQGQGQQQTTEDGIRQDLENAKQAMKNQTQHRSAPPPTGERLSIDDQPQAMHDIRQDLKDAKRAMSSQTVHPTGNRLSIDDQPQATVLPKSQAAAYHPAGQMHGHHPTASDLDGMKRLSIESVEAPPNPPAVDGLHGGGMHYHKLPSIESMATTQPMNNTEANISGRVPYVKQLSIEGMSTSDQQQHQQHSGLSPDLPMSRVSEGGESERGASDIDEDETAPRSMRGGGEGEASPYGGDTGSVDESNRDDESEVTVESHILSLRGGGGGGVGEDEDDHTLRDSQGSALPNFDPSAFFQSELDDKIRESATSAATEDFEGGGGAEIGGEGSVDRGAPNFSAFPAEFNDLVYNSATGGSSVAGGSAAEYQESQDNPFSDTNSFYGTDHSKASFSRQRFGGGGGSSVGGGSSYRGYDVGDGSSVGGPYSDTAYSESAKSVARGGLSQYGSDVSSSFKNYGRASSTASKSFIGNVDEEHNEDNMSAHNPFSDTASYRSSNFGMAGGSSVYSRSDLGGDGNKSIRAGGSSVFSGSHYGSSKGMGQIDEYGDEGGGMGGGGSAYGDVTNEYDNGEDPAAAPDRPTFDEHGGYRAPAVFAGYDDDTQADGDDYDQRRRGVTSYEQSGAASYDQQSGYGGSSHLAGSEYAPSSHEGYSDEINHHQNGEYERYGYSNDHPNSQRQSASTSEWDEQSGRASSQGFADHDGANKSSGMFMASGNNGLGLMSELEEHLPPLGAPQLYPPEKTMHPGQFHTDDEQESKYSDYPFETDDGGGQPLIQQQPHSGVVQEEDIFQFKEPRLSMTPQQDYLNYSDPVEGDICPLAVRKVLKILRYFSRVLSAMEILAQHTGVVDALLYHMTKKPLSVDYDDEISSRVDAIAVVVNLACAEENKIMLVYHPGLLDAVINIANHDPIDEAREHAAIVLMNLAYAEENKVHMVNQDHLLDTLVHLLSDVSPFTRRYASAALFTLACTYANTAVMARHCDGGILEALRKVLLNDPIDEARVNAAEALFNMARNNSDDTVENMGNHPRLLASLSHSVLTDYSADVRAYSARALEWLSADIHYPMPCHRILLKALTKASQWTKTTCIAEALKMQASLSENRKPMVEHPGLLDALATLSLLDGINDDDVQTCAISAIERLSKEASTRHIMVKNEGVMTALTKATFAKDGAEDDVPDEGTPTALLMKTALKNLSAHL
eukprot:CAMPEP_0181095532 /NCGR_PEP_ID=MMETSP1071-20121207/10565_1 /TAXON_ID=35127 /ORGANISM="Thalassiosira sp., Strain NH16" /LENGTH=1590 /DNA_ID=CAMNT_0023177911 /DNA_START=86 /DNA_END=4858 /DNA_ORIENTATION=+